MTHSTPAPKLIIHNPAAFVGKIIDSTKWNIPDGYWQCAMTGKLFAEADLLATFEHWKFDRQFLIANRIYIECADWLSAEGYDLIMSTLDRLGQYDYYLNS